MDPLTFKNIRFQHNIVSLLYSIQGMAESYLSQVEEGRFLKEEERLRRAEETLKRNHRQAERALKITRRIGRLLKKEPALSNGRGKAFLEKAWRSVKQMLAKDFPSLAFEFLERVPAEFPPLRLPQKELVEVLYILAKNSLQALQNGSGRMGGELPKLIIRAQLAFSTREEPFASITLADTGPGIPREKLHHLFRLFSTSKSEGEGNGLGLYLAREIVLNHEGKMTVSSFKDFGATFTIELPLYFCRRSRQS